MKALLLAVLFLFLQTESSEFTISVNGLRVGTEEFSVSRRGGGFLATGRTELRVGTSRVVAESRMELDAEFNPLTYQYNSGDQAIRMEIGQDSTRVDITVAGESTSYDVRFPAGGMIVDDNFFHHYVLLMNRVEEDGGSLPVFVPQQLTIGSLQVVPSGEMSYDLTTENLTLRASVDGEGRLVELRGLDGSVVVER